jgi:hypothetical protein
VVHTVSSADPLADLPPGAATALQGWLLPLGTVDLGGVLERCEAVQELVERWQDAFFASLPDEVDLAEEARHAAEAGLSLDDVESGYDEDDDDLADLDLPSGSGELPDDGLDDLVELVEPAEDDPRRSLPEELVTVLERELLLLPLRVRLEALVAAADLVSQWSDLVADHEKLLGHLVLAHGEVPQPLGHDDLVGRHASLHAVSGPGHLVGPP